MRLRGALATAVLVLVAWTASADRFTPGIDFVDPRVFEIDALETRRKASDKVVVSGRLLGEHEAPEVIVVRPDGRAYEVDPDHLKWQKPAVSAEILLQGPGVYRVEVTGLIPPDVTHSGTRLRLFAGVPTDTPDEPVPADDPIREDLYWTMIEARFFGLVNEARAKAKLGPFVWLEPLADAGRDLAKAAVKVGKLDHIVDVDGTVAQRLSRMYGWKGLVYRRPPKMPSPAPGATSYVCASTDQGWALEPIVYRWSRFPAFCLPMTSERMTHAACAVARRKDGYVYLVFVYAQINDTTRIADAESRYRGLLDFWKAGKGKADANRLRELGHWRRPEGRAEAKKAQDSAVPELRAAGWDVALLVDEEAARKKLDRFLADLQAAAAVPRRREEALATSSWMIHLQFAPDLLQEAWRIHQTLTPPPQPGGPDGPK